MNAAMCDNGLTTNEIPYDCYDDQSAVKGALVVSSLDSCQGSMIRDRLGYIWLLKVLPLF